MAVLAALAVLSVWLYVTLDRREGARIWTGTDGPFIGDQMQYLGWIRDASDNLRIGNPYLLVATRQLFIHPGVVISGVLNRAGLSAAAAYMVWKPIAVVAMFLAVRALVHRHVEGRATRLLGMVLALFGVSPLPVLAADYGVGPRPGVFYFQATSVDMWPGLYLWGYPFTAIAVALMPITLLTYERARTDGRIPVLAASCAFFVSWLQPWQGATMILVIGGAELLSRRGPRAAPLAGAVVTIGAACVPLFYYALLSRVDDGWAHASLANRNDFPWWVIVMFATPFLLLTVIDFLRPAASFGHHALRLWPVAGVAVFLFIDYASVGTFQLHALQSLSIPVGILAARMVAAAEERRLRPVALALAATLVLTCLGPSLDGQLRRGPRVVGAPQDPFYLTPAEADAMRFLSEDPRAGGVLSRSYLGQTVPGLADRRTWVGIASWTPDFAGRTAKADALFRRRVPAARARRFVIGTRARFLLSDCRSDPDVGKDLASIVAEVHRFGCAAVYVLR